MNWHRSVYACFVLVNVLIYIAPSGSSAQPFSVGLDVNVNASAKNYDPAVEVIIEANPVNPKHLVLQANTQHFLYYSLDGGMTWNHTDVSLPPSLQGIALTDPSLAFADDGTLYAAKGAEENIDTIAVCRFDHGAFNVMPVPSSCTEVPVVAQQKWHIGAGPTPGKPIDHIVYVAYQGPGFADIGVAYLTNGATTFTQSLSNPLGTGHFPRPVVAGNGDVYVAWYQSNGEIRVARSTDGGQNFGASVLAASPPYLRSEQVPPQPDRGIFTGPVIDTDRSGGPHHGSVYITYVGNGSHGGSDYDIFVVSSEDGVNWNSPVRVNSDTGASTQFLPWLDVDQKTGTLSVIWYDPRNDPTNNVKVRTYLATSVDGGETFGPNIAIADAESDEADRVNYLTSSFDYAEYIGVAVDGCVAHAAWSDNHMTRAFADGAFIRNPNSNETLTLNGVKWTFVDGPAKDFETEIGSDRSATIARLIADLSASSDPRISAAEYSHGAVTIRIQAKSPGLGGGLFTLAADDFMLKPPFSGRDRLEILLNTKTDQVPVPCAPGNEILVVDALDFPAGAASIRRYHRESGAFREEFVPNCADVAPHGNCSEVPGASENPVEIVYGPDKKLYVADAPISAFGFNATGIAVKRYNGSTGSYDDPSHPDPHAAFIHYGDGGLEQVGGLTFGPDSNLYVSDFFTGAVHRYHGQTGKFLGTYVPIGTLHEPRKILFGPDGNLYVVESGGNRISRFQGPFSPNPGEGLPEFIASGTGLTKTISGIFGPEGQMFISVGDASAGYTIHRYQGPFDSTPGALVDSITFPSGTVLSSSAGLVFGPDESLYVSDRGNRSGVLRLDLDTKTIRRVAYARQPSALFLTSVPDVEKLLGDFNADGCVDRSGDLMILINAVRTRTTDKQFDLNGDGLINIADARKLTLLFTHPPRGNACSP